MQGVTEFLPISSSGHLVFFQSLLGFEGPPLFFDVFLHLGTLFAVIVFFRSDLHDILCALMGKKEGKSEGRQGARMLTWVVLATLPTGLMGFLFRGWFETLFSKPKMVGMMLVVTGFVLWLTRYCKAEGRSLERMNWRDALLIGVAQGLAIIPGISRSGATIGTGLFCGLERDLSGRFSFLLSIPAILGATALEFREIETPPQMKLTILGTAVAFLDGFVSLKFLMKIIREGKLFHFAYYCWAMGLVMILLGKP